ncbi:hypothetical protein B296_00033268 [Ensete ventricosum]|uniref:Uncharacterized protein n=1 Tax=Ensete ventricosum TaxID=4639 RepID=A0A426X7I8_ENSVE|nr:hypothetical protein B296_00033268 [Ensete ventricosum]
MSTGLLHSGALCLVLLACHQRLGSHVLMRPFRVRSESGRRSDFVTGLASESRKLRRLRRLGAVAAPPQAGPPSLGLLVTPFAGVPPGEPIGVMTLIKVKPKNPASSVCTWIVREGDGIVHRKGSHNDPCCSHSSSSVASVVQAGGLRSRASASSAHNLGESRPSSSFPSRSSPADMPALAVVLHRSLAAASSAADRMSLGSELLGRGSCSADSGKLSCASQPLSRSAATSCATAAISADSKLPSQILVFFPGSRISDTHFPHFLFLTPRYCSAKSPLISASCSIADLRTELLSFLTR